MTLLRCLIVGVLAVAAARPLWTLLADRRRPIRRAAWVLLLAPYFTPVLLTGYAYANFSLSLLHHPALNTVFYSALLWWKFTPLAAVILYFTPAPISAEAIHCRRLGCGARLCMEPTNRVKGAPGTAPASFTQPVIAPRRCSALRFMGRRLVAQFEFCIFLLRAGCARGPVAAFAVVFLCAFAEFEMASLMVVKSWTVALFDAHAGGLALSEALRRMLGPLGCEAAAIATAFVVLGRRQVIPAQRLAVNRLRHWFAWGHLLTHAFTFPNGMGLRHWFAWGHLLTPRRRRWRCSWLRHWFAWGHLLTPSQTAVATAGLRHWFAWGHLLTALIFVLLIPAAMVLWGTLRGFGLLLENFVLSREILASLLSAAGASMLAGLAAWGLVAAARGREPGSSFCKLVLLAAVFAGLLGPLVLALAVLAAVQLPGLILLRDTPVPLVGTLGLVLLPMALVWQRVLELTRHRSGLHLTTLMQKSRAVRELTWQLSTSGKFWAMTLLFIWAYWDLTASSILAPIGMTPVTVRLYNLMHYGQIAALSAMTCAAFAAPIFILLAARGTRRWWAPS